MAEYCTKLETSIIAKCRVFSEESAKTQREHRSGGTYQRSTTLIVRDTFRGKLGECIVEKFFVENGVPVELDFEVYERGKWDEADILVNGNTIAIKSSKHFARWLLLESKDLERESYDYYLFVKVYESMDGGCIAGYVDKDTVFDKNDADNKWLAKGECIPGTQVPLDAANFGRKQDNLSTDWQSLFSKIKETPS